jgi:Acyl-CoA dehydrogenase, C-terminal domain
MDEAERTLLSATVHDAVAAAASTPAAIDAALTDLGWLDMLASEPRDAVEIVFNALGAANAMSSALDDVVASVLGVPARADLAVLLPPFASWSPPGVLDPRGLVAAGLASARVATATELLVVGCDGSELVTMTMAMTDVDRTPVRGVDPDAGLYTMYVTAPAAASVAPLDGEAWGTATAFAQRALAHQMAAASRVMLGLACAHAREREQFGRPVARFQAVRHRLADALVAVEALEAAVAAADDEQSPTTAALAKAVAGRTARTVAAHCQQVLAGVGFTTDHPFHRFMKRTMLLDGIFGSADALVVAIGRQLLATRTVPTLIEL